MVSCTIQYVLSPMTKLAMIVVIGNNRHVWLAMEQSLIAIPCKSSSFADFVIKLHIDIPYSHIGHINRTKIQTKFTQTSGSDIEANMWIRVISWVAAYSNKQQTKSYKVDCITMCINQIQIKFTLELPYIHCITWNISCQLPTKRT